MLKNWGPHSIIPPVLSKTVSRDTVLTETLDYDLLREQLVANQLPLEVQKVRNYWFYRRQDLDGWLSIGQSEDIESNFSVTWDISGLQNGIYEIMALMEVSLAEGYGEEAVIARQCFNKVTILN